MVSLLLFVLLIGVPIMEIYTFIQVGEAIGAWPTIGLVILTAVLGTALIRRQGMAVLQRAQEALVRGRAPLREVFDGVCLLVAGVLLLTPGLITDSMGFALLLPPMRVLLLALMVTGIKSGKITVPGRWSGRANGGISDHFSNSAGGFDSRSPFNAANGPCGGPRPGRRWDPDPGVVEGDYHDITDQSKRSSGSPNAGPPHKPRQQP